MFSLLSDEGSRVLWKWAHLPQGGSPVHEALDTVNLYLWFITFPPSFCFKFQFQISSDLPFISLRDGLIYTSSSDSFLPAVAIGYLFTSRRVPPALLKGWAMTHKSPHFDEIKAMDYFFMSLQNTPPIQCLQTHLILLNTSKGPYSPHWHHKSELQYFENSDGYVSTTSFLTSATGRDGFSNRWVRRKVIAVISVVLLPSAAPWAFKHSNTWYTADKK